VKRSGMINVTTTGDTTNAVAGNITSWGVGFLMAVVLSLIFPAKYNSKDPKEVERYNKIHGIKPISGEEIKTSSPASGRPSSKASEDEKHGDSIAANPQEMNSNPTPTTFVPTGNELVDYLEMQHMEPMDPVEVKKGERLAVIFNGVFILVAIILVPFTLFGTKYIFNRAFFTGFVVVSFIWVWVSMCICVIYPVVESTGALRQISKGLFNDLAAVVGKRKPKTAELANHA